MEQPPTKKIKLSGRGKHRKEWESLKGPYEGWIQASKSGEAYSYCVPCRKDVKVLASGFYDLKTHFGTTGHKHNVSKSKTFKPMDEHFFSKANSSPPNKATAAEIMFCQFLAEHNIPPSVADHFTDLVKAMFPDSKLAQVRFLFIYFVYIFFFRIPLWIAKIDHATTHVVYHGIHVISFYKGTVYGFTYRNTKYKHSALRAFI